MLQARPLHWPCEEDLAVLSPLNESETISQLASRFTEGHHQTRLGQDCLLSINPMVRTEDSPRESLWQLKGSENNDELDSLLLQQVEAVYQKAVSTREPQSIIMTGKSGSGKTDNFKRALEYLVESSPSREQSCFSGIRGQKSIKKEP